MVVRVLKNLGDPLVDGSGNPVAGARLNFTLVDSKGQVSDGWDVMSGERVAPGPLSVVTDASGLFAIPLWPTTRGDRVLYWKCSVNIEGIQDFRGVVPYEVGDLQWYEFRFGTNTIGDPGPAPAAWTYATAFPTLAEADAAAAAAGRMLVITTVHEIPIAATLNAAIWVVPGGGFNGPGALNITNKIFRAEKQQIFFGLVQVLFTNLGEIPVEWQGAKADYDATDNTQPIIRSIASITAGNILYDYGTYKVTGQVTTSKPYINHFGMAEGGRGVTKIRFVPTANGTCFMLDAVVAGSLYQNAIKNIEFTSPLTDGDFTKVAIQTRDADTLTIENVSIVYWSGQHNSVGLKWGGRQFLRCKKCTIYADKPIQISQNPYRADVANIDIDNSRFTDMYMVAGSAGYAGGPVVTIDTGVHLTNVTFDGHQSWVPYASYGLYWLDTTSAGVSTNLKIENLRIENETDPNTHMIYISHNSTLQNLQVNQISGGLTQKGIFLRKVDNVNIRNWYYVNSINNEALNVDATVKGLSWDAVFAQSGTTASITGQNLITAVQQETGALYRCARYSATAEGATQFLSDKWISGARVTVADDIAIDLATNVYKGALLIADSEGRVAMYAINGSINSTAELFDVGGVFSVTKDQDGTTNIYWDGGTSTYRLQNKRGGSRDYYITRLGG